MICVDESSDDTQESCLFNTMSKIFVSICTSYTFQRYVSVLNFETDVVETPQYKVGRLVYMFWRRQPPSFAMLGQFRTILFDDTIRVRKLSGPIF